MNAALDDLLNTRLGELGVSAAHPGDAAARRVLTASDLAFDVLRREPTLIAQLTEPDRWLPTPTPEIDVEDFPGALRRYRKRESLRLIARDVLGADAVAETLTGATRLAERCIEQALRFAELELSARFGFARDAHGQPMRLAVIGMGKLGGGELNFSSDVDLILTYAGQGDTDGARKLSHEEYFARVGQRLAQVLGDVSVDGFVARVDYRLRPFGTAGRVAWTFDAMEQYYQREGRDWERYAWIKARTVAGDLVGGAGLIDALRPFVYRRYLDFTAIEGLREMKSRIDLEVDRRDLDGNLKLGPGGIRECEFIVQLAQMIRGGREPKLRTPSFYQALAVSIDCGFLDAEEAGRLRSAYEFLRRIENRVQMLADEQTHGLPQDELGRWRIASALGYSTLAQLDADIAEQRALVSALFARVLDPPTRNKPLQLGEDSTETPGELIASWSAAVADAFRGLLNSLPVKRMDTAAKARFERATPRLLGEARRQALDDAQLLRLLRLLHAIAGRSSYLALLAERRGARERVVEVFKRSAFLAERVIAHPLLLDDLLDEREGEQFQVAREFERHLQRAPADDPEALLIALNEAKQSALFRTGLDWLAGRLDALRCSRQLAEIAEVCLRQVFDCALAEHRGQHGVLGRGLLVLAYGSFGGAELGFASDLDLVFVYDDVDDELQSDGARPLDRGRYFARLAQRLLHWLGTATRAGSLYEVDMRLRPDGAKGLLVSSLATFGDYQRERAWTYEQQALVRARLVAGDIACAPAVSAVRSAVLARPRELSATLAEVARMRARWRQELDRSNASVFDLKQGHGGLVDIEFLVQALVLAHAERQPRLLEDTATERLLGLLADCDLLSAADSLLLADAHQAWLGHALNCTLDGRPRVIARDAEVDARAASVAKLIARYLGTL